MKANNKKIIPVLLGGDLNAYSVALAFMEAYNVSSHAFVRYRCGATENSNFIKTHICSELDNVEIAVTELLKFAWENVGYELYLIPCSDIYLDVIDYGERDLREYYKFILPEKNMRRRLTNKHKFMQDMEEENIPYPKYVAFSKNEIITDKKLSEIKYPAVIKPSDSAEYWKNPFPKMKKVYFPENKLEAFDIIYKIFSTDYSSDIILQNRVSGEEKLYVLTTFSDKGGNVVRAALGEVLLEECGETSQGNHAAIITVPLDSISKRLIEYLNKIKYVGFANFDIMSDGNKKYVLELNARQGRSCDYLRCCGINIAMLIVESLRGKKLTQNFDYSEIYWHYPPHRLVMEYSESKLRETAERLTGKGRSYSPYVNRYEGIKRSIYVVLHNYRLRDAFKKSFLKRDESI